MSQSQPDSTRNKSNSKSQSGTAQKRDSRQQETFRFPSLRSVLIIYLLTLLASAGITLSLSSNIEPLFIRFTTAIFIVLGLTYVSLRILRMSLFDLWGRAPAPVLFILCLIIGVVLFIPAQWLSFPMYLFLDRNVGTLPPPVPSRNVSQITYIIQYGIIIPLCYGMLFWGLIARSAIRSYRLAGAILTAVLYACFGILNYDLAVSTIPGWLIIGVFAALLVYFTDNMWYGTAVTAGFNLGLIFVQLPLLQDYLQNDVGNLLSIKWLFAVIVALFVSIVLFQIVRLRDAAGRDGIGDSVETTGRNRGKSGFMWWLPLLLSALLIGFVVYGEMTVRARQKMLNSPPPAHSNEPSSMPPVPTTTAP